MTPHSKAADDRAVNGRADVADDDQAARVWAAIRELVASHPSKQLVRDTLDLGRGSGRAKSLMRLTQGPLSLSSLADAVGVDAPYATLIVDNLEERGLVERQPDPADRRRKLVSLTREGKTAVGQLLRMQQDPPTSFGTLSTAELDTLEGLVRRLTAGSAAGWMPDDASRPGTAGPAQVPW
jgi:DNA-binding MarR family transcriptional regulator